MYINNTPKIILMNNKICKKLKVSNASPTSLEETLNPPQLYLS